MVKPRQVAPSAALLSDTRNVFVDVRQYGELLGGLGHVASSLNVPLPDVLNDVWTPSCPPDAQIVVVCRSGGRAGEAAAHLMQRGYSNVAVLQGGMLNWNKTPGCPTVRVNASTGAVRLRDAIVSTFCDAFSLQPSDRRVAAAFDGAARTHQRNPPRRVGGGFASPEKRCLREVVRELGLLARAIGASPDAVTSCYREMLSLLDEPTTQEKAIPLPAVTCLYHDQTGTCVYVAHDAKTKDAVIIDPVLDYAANSGRTTTTHADAVLAHVKKNELRVRYILETHVHADHLTAAQYLKRQLPGSMVCIGEGIKKVQETWKPKLALEASLPTDGSQFDRLLTDGDELPLSGELSVKTLFTPGHTPDSNSYLIGDAVFVGDTIFMPDQGAARCDFPNGDARALYKSVQRLYSLPQATRVFTGHDYKAGGRAAKWESRVGEQAEKQSVMPRRRTEQDFVAFRQKRDAQLQAPGLLFPAVQFNLRAGSWGPEDSAGRLFMKVPVSKL